MMYYRVALQLHNSFPWKWQSTILVTLEALFRFLKIDENLGLSNDRIRVFFASSQQGLDEMLARENQGAVSNSMTVNQLVTRSWRISPAEMRRLEIELRMQEHEGLGKTTVPSEGQ